MVKIIEFNATEQLPQVVHVIYTKNQHEDKGKNDLHNICIFFRYNTLISFGNIFDKRNCIIIGQYTTFNYAFTFRIIFLLQ